jgi:hypothetical protein
VTRTVRVDTIVGVAHQQETNTTPYHDQLDTPTTSASYHRLDVIAP